MLNFGRINVLFSLVIEVDRSIIELYCCNTPLKRVLIKAPIAYCESFLLVNQIPSDLIYLI